MSSTPSHTNQLIHESSPYLLQHAHNPVDWYPWKDELKARAEREDKLLLISIGYSACHWCHVMEKECFEDEQVAELMNAHFICVKVDREERPDIDQVYMNAVQLMTGHGGWPLNCITLADGKPIYGGTYFPKESWTSVLKKIIELKTHDRPRMLEYAEKLTLGVQQSELIAPNKSKIDFTRADLDDLYYNWSKLFDNQEGGPDRAPKFPLPNNYQFLLRFAHLSKNKELENHVKLTLNKIAFGGIYDHLGGGFARYSVDAFWKVPHFEKMLYDNAQLVSLFAEAYQAYPDPLYKKVVAETLKFVAEELQSPQGGFYSALDADSEGVEGKYYTWTKNELQDLLATDFELFAHAYSVDERGYWEDGQYILLRKESLESLAQRHDLTLELLHEKLEKCKNILLTERSKRVKPGLDDKILCSWNALMIKGLADAYRVFGDKAYLHSAENAFQFLLKNMQDRERLSHSFKNGKATINGFLEDYAFLIEACISLYEATFNATYLHQAKTLMAYCLKHFSSSESEFLFFTSDEDSPLIARKSETSDNVIPASNSSIAKSLFLLGHFFDENLWIEKSANMLHQVKHLMIRYGSGYSNWAQLQLIQVFPFYELVISGADAESLRAEVERHYFPNKLMLGSSIAGDLPLLKNKWVADKTFIYLCINKTCQLPVDNVAAAFLQLEQE